MKITIIGTGYVGLVTGAVFAEKGHHVLCVDNNQETIQRLQKGEIPFYEPGLDELVASQKKEQRLSFTLSITEGVDHAEVIFVAVGTPPTSTGEADLTSVQQVACDIARYVKEYRLIVEKSTVPVHTGEKIRQIIERQAPPGVTCEVASNPEFLREGQALEDARKPDRIVVGVHSQRAEQLLRQLYQSFAAPLIVTDVNSAELIKYAANSFLAMKISYSNALAVICELAGGNIQEVARGVGLDRRIGQAFLNAGIGYGGSCFPKDVEAFIHIADRLGFDFSLLREVQRINQEQRQRFLKKIENELWVVKGKTIAVLGLAFKPETDDLREAPALEIIEGLTSRGAQVRVYDPKALDKARRILSRPAEPGSFEARVQQSLKAAQLVDDVYELFAEADCLALVTEWPLFQQLDFPRIKAMMRQPILVDGRNLYEPKTMASYGFTYRSIGR